MDSVQLVVVAAGLRQPSSTRMLADRLAAAAERELLARGGSGADASQGRQGESGADGGLEVQVRVIELRELATDIAHNLVTGFPNAALAEALKAVESADGLIAVSPIFSASYSGLFKSFFDLIDPQALSGTPVLIAATGGSARHSLALEHALRPLFAYLHATVVPTAVYAATEDWGASSGAETVDLAARVDRAAAELATFVTGSPRARGRSAAVGDDAEDFDDVVPFEQLLGR
jgi:FMN reductase